MHLQQTKRASRTTGGPQYYFHDLPDIVKFYLRDKGVVRVALVTPYGATKSDYFAVGANHKLDSKMQPIAGKVGHDRIQQGRARKSIGESIRHWYKLSVGDFERIDLDIEIKDDVFYLRPITCKYADSRKRISIERIDKPLSFTKNYISPFWIRQLDFVEKQWTGIVKWSLEEICRIVKDHRSKSKVPHIQETDLLRASGSLCHLGLKLGSYVGKGYDCISEFSFLDYPAYSVPIEIKRNSAGFQYQQQKYGKDELSRAIVLCAVHSHKHLPGNIDVIELESLCNYFRNL